MSSINRKNSKERHISDYYVTPVKEIELFLREFDKRVKLDWQHSRILDPCAGGNKEERVGAKGGIIRAYHHMSYQEAIKNVFGENCKVTNLDIRPDSLAELKGDYLKSNVNFIRPQIIISNPPFATAIHFINKALEDLEEGGYAIFLLRLNFLGSAERFPFWKKQLPDWCFVHHERISFTDKADKWGYVQFNRDGNLLKGSADSIEYAHFVFKKGSKPNYTKLVVI